MALASKTDRLRVVLETDAPYMTPTGLYKTLPALKPVARMVSCHSGMIPWTAEFAANKLVESEGEDSGWTAERFMKEAREGARIVYGI